MLTRLGNDQNFLEKKSVEGAVMDRKRLSHPLPTLVVWRNSVFLRNYFKDNVSKSRFNDFIDLKTRIVNIFWSVNEKMF